MEVLSFLIIDDFMLPHLSLQSGWYPQCGFVVRRYFITAFWSYLQYWNKRAQVTGKTDLPITEGGRDHVGKKMPWGFRRICSNNILGFFYLDCSVSFFRCKFLYLRSATSFWLGFKKRNLEGRRCGCCTGRTCCAWKNLSAVCKHEYNRKDVWEVGQKLTGFCPAMET